MLSKLIITMCLICAFVSCGKPVSSADFKVGLDLCESNGGLDKISNINYHQFIYCENGAEFTLSKER